MVIDSMQGSKISSHNMVFYKSLGHLLRDYRQWRKLSQERLAESIGVSTRQLRNWEAGNRAGIENLHDISEVTGIPMQVCVALNAGQPIWYSLQKMLFMYSLIEEDEYYSNNLLKHGSKSDNKTMLKKVAITKDRQIDMILSRHNDLYGPEKTMQRDVIKAAASILYSMNYIILDCWGHYLGHHICLPIKMDVYRELKKQKSIENYLKSNMISDIIAIDEGVFFSYSGVAVNLSTAAWFILNCSQNFFKIKRKKRYLLANYLVTQESAIISKNIGMKFVKDYASKLAKVRPAIYETELDYYLRSDGPMRYIIEQLSGEAMSLNTTRRSKQICPPAISYNKPRNLASHFKKDSPKEIMQFSTLTVDKNINALTVDTFSSVKEKQTYQKKIKFQITESNKEIKVCPNIKCTLYNKSGKANIISNGTFRLKDNTVLRRFICKKCGKSFSSNTPIIFYGLRSPDEKILKALKLLLKGMSLQDVSEIIKVDFRTVSSWLKIASKREEEINTILIDTHKFYQTELETLWAFVKKNSFRKRPVKDPLLGVTVSYFPNIVPSNNRA